MDNQNRELIRRLLKKYWGYDAFRPLQEDIILSVLNGQDTLALLPTGGGKSICFQVPALAFNGLCIVISPLIALMKDQVAHLKTHHIKAVAIYSGMSYYEIESAIQNVLYDKEYRFLYVSPERLQTDLLRLNFAKMPVTMIAVDEAHCISQWGYDFRPPYLQIAEIRKTFPDVPVLALTATATPEVVKDIQLRLGFQKENVFQKSFKRDNLTYFVVNEEDKHGRLLRVMNRYPGTGIVYVRSRRKTADVAEFLKKNGISADFYHAGLDAKSKDRKQQAWMTGKIRVIVATNAFGMGIDKPDVRFVVHLDIPDSLEAYFQEAGRGGRDEKPSVAILLYDKYDLRQLRTNFTLSFPEVDVIRKVYYTLCQHYDIPVGGGQNRMFPFYLEQHAREIQMNVTQYFNALQFLSKIGVIALSEHLRDHSKLHFCMNGDELLHYEEQHSQYEDFIKLILRSYSGVFTDYVEIDEILLANRSELTTIQVKEYLTQLHQAKVIHYEPQSNVPLLIFVQDRVKEEYLYFDSKIYAARKENALKRLQAVENYVTSQTECRSQLLLSYFGEKHSLPCGECDVCRKLHKQYVPDNLFQEIENHILELVSRQVLSHKEILSQMSLCYEEEQVVSVMRWLIDQNKIQ